MASQTTKPRPAPEYNEGDWAFNNVMGHNARIVNVSWDDSLHGHAGGWRYNMPGYSVVYPYAEEPSKPYVQYQQVDSHGWKEIGPCDRDTLNIPL